MNVERDNLITPEGYNKLVDELNNLQKNERPRVVEEVSAAAKQGDRSENAEYIYGKKRLREIDSRSRFLSKRIDRARVISPREQSGDKVLFGGTVKVQNDEGEIREYQIVGEDEFDVKRGRISWKSPVGKGLLNRKVGDVVSVETPRGLLELEIVEIVFK